MKDAKVKMPKFRDESEEADWWASAAGRAYVKDKSAARLKKGKQKDRAWSPP
jgi:hypothetical protein